MSTVKSGYGYGHSKPMIKYHSQEAPASVTTVVTETSGMRVHEKPPYNGAGAVSKKHTFLEQEVVHEKPPYNGAGAVSKKHTFLEQEVTGVYSGRHGGNVQKHAFLEENAGVYSGHRGGTVQKHVGSAVPTHQYREQKEESDSSEESGDESDSEEELAYRQHGTGGLQNHGYGEQKTYHDSSIENHGYGGKQAYQDDAGYGALHHGITAQKKYGYAVGKQRAYELEGDVAGYDTFIQPRAARMHAYGGYSAQNVIGLDAQGYQMQQKGFLTSYFVIWNPWGKKW